MNESQYLRIDRGLTVACHYHGNNDFTLPPVVPCPCFLSFFFSFVFSVVLKGIFGGSQDERHTHKKNYCEAGTLCHDLFIMGGFPVKGNTSSQCVRLPWVVRASDLNRFRAVQYCPSVNIKPMICTTHSLDVRRHYNSSEAEILRVKKRYLHCTPLWMATLIVGSWPCVLHYIANSKPYVLAHWQTRR